MTKIHATTGARGPDRHLATNLLGCQVTDSRAEPMGSIVEFMLDRRHRRIAYAVVSLGGSGDGSRKHFAMPCSRLQFDDSAPGSSLQASSDIVHAALVATTGFARDDWPEVADSIWTTPGPGEPGFAGAIGATTEPANANRAPAAPTTKKEHAERQQDLSRRRLTRLIGMKVVDRQYRVIAGVLDLLFDLRRATVDGLVLVLGHDADGADLVVLVPAEAMLLDADQGVFVLPTDGERLQRMAKPLTALPTWNRSDWSHVRLELLAISPPCPTRVAEPVAHGAFLPDVPAANTGMGYGGLLDRVLGTILALQSSSRQRRGQPRLHLRVRTDAGREVIAIAAELGDAAQTAMRLDVGHAIEMRGWWAIQGPHSLLILRSIRHGEHTLRIDEGPRDQITMP